MLQLLLFLIIIVPAFLVLAAPIIKGAPFLPISSGRLKALMKLANGKKNDRAVDLGSGDGRIIIEFAKRGIEAHGYEINPLLVIISKLKIKKAKLQNKAFVHWNSFWNVDFSKFNIVTAYPVKHIMKSLEKKLRNNTRSGTKIIMHIFKFPDWKYTKKLDYNYLYIKKPE